MNFSCEACQHRYSVPDEKVRGRMVRIRCRHCGHLTSVTGPDKEAPTASGVEWHAMIRGQQAGPFDLAGLAERVRAGEVSAGSFVWRLGMEDWLRAGELPELLPVLRLPPPPDPFAALGAPAPSAMPAPGEATMFFMHQAGVTKRNPRWKLAAFIGSGVAAVALVVLVLSSLDEVPLTGPRVDAPVEAPEPRVFSADGVSPLGDVLLGREEPAGDEVAARSATERRRRPAPKPVVAPAAETEPPVPPKAKGPSNAELAALYADPERSDRGPRVRPASVEQAAAKVTTGDGLSAEQLHKVVASSQTAFQGCIESELRKNPNLRVPRFFIRATVAPSGAVTATSIDRREVDGSALGECLKTRARRMAFAPFEGEDLVVEIPLIVGVAM